MALSDILKKYGDTSATEGIMFPSAGVKPVTTEQEVYDSATDGIMTINNEKYIGPTATVTYTGEDQGYARTLRQIEQGELPQFDQSTFPEVGTGVMQPTTPVTPPVTTPVEPEQPAPPIDPCPAGYKLINGVCQPIQRQDRDRPQEEPMFGPGKTPFQNVEFANNIIFGADDNEQFNYYKDNQIVLKQASSSAVIKGQQDALQDYFNKNNIDLDANNLDYSAFEAYAREAGIPVAPAGNNVKFNLSNISNKPEGGISIFPGVDAVMALAEKDMIKGALNLYNNAGLTTGMYIGDSIYYAGTAEYNTAFNNALKNNSDFNLIFDPIKVNNFNKNFGKLNTDIQANRNLLNNLSKLNKDMVETTIVKLAASGQGVDKIKNMSKAQLIAFASPREDIHAKSFGFNKYSPKTKKQIVEAKHDNDSISKTSMDTINRMANDERAGYRVDVRELSKREHNNKNSYASKNKETADETIARIAKNVEEDPMAKRTGSSAFANEKTKESIKSGNDSKNEKKIVCTEMYKQTQLQDWVRAIKIWDIYQKKYLTPIHEIGYHWLFKPYVQGMKKSSTMTSLGAYLAKERTKHLKHILTKRKSKDSFVGNIWCKIIHPIVYIAGKIKKYKGDK